MMAINAPSEVFSALTELGELLQTVSTATEEKQVSDAIERITTVLGHIEKQSMDLNAIVAPSKGGLGY